MRALLKKELTEVLVPFGIAFVVIVIFWFGSARFWDAMLPPASQMLEVAALSSALAGAVLGYVQFSGERWRGKIGYLCHRGTGVDGAFFAKAIAGLLGTALIGLGPPLAYAISASLYSPNASILDGSLVLAYASAATCGATLYSLGVLAASLRRRVVVGILLIPLAGSGLWLISELCGTPWGLETSPWPFPAMQLALASVLLLLARRLARSGADADLPLPRGAHWAIVALTVPLVLFPCDVLASVFQGSMLSEIRSEYPMIVRDREKGEFFPVVWSADGGMFRLRPDGGIGEGFAFGNRPDLEHGFERVFQGRSPSGASETEPAPARMRSLLQKLRTRRGLTPIDMQWLRYSNRRFVINKGAPANLRMFLDRERGVVRAFAFTYGVSPDIETDDFRRVPFAIEFGKPDAGGRFSPDTIILNGRGEAVERLFEGYDAADPAEHADVNAFACLFDPEDRTLWRLDPFDPQTPIARVDLPGGDRFVGLETMYSRSELVFGRYEDPWENPLLVGERGRYAWNGLEFVDFLSSGRLATASEAKDLFRFRVVVDDRDPLRWTVRVLDARDDREQFTYAYAPRSGWGSFIALAAQATVLLRSPLANSLVAGGVIRQESRTDGNAEHRSEFLARGRRPWLWVLDLLVALSCAGICARMLRRRNATVAWIGLGSVFVLLFGPVALLVVWLLEPKGPARAIPVAAAVHEPALAIQSA